MQGFFIAMLMVFTHPSATYDEPVTKVACQNIMTECELLLVTMSLSDISYEPRHGYPVDRKTSTEQFEVKMVIDNGDEVVNLVVNETGEPLLFKPKLLKRTSWLKWYTRELGRPWKEIPIMECRCTMWGQLEIYVGGKLIETKP